VTATPTIGSSMNIQYGKLLLAVLLVIIVLPPVVADEPTASPSTTESPAGEDHLGKEQSKAIFSSDDAMRILGQTMLCALQKNDIKMFRKCWMLEDDMNKVLEGSTTSSRTFSKEHQAAMKEHVHKLKDVVTAIFPLLRRALVRTYGDLSKIRLESISATGKDVGETTAFVSSFIITFSSSNEVKVAYVIDDGFYVNNRWHFTDQPSAYIRIIANDRTKKVSLTTFATKAERKLFDSLPGTAQGNGVGTNGARDE